MEARRSQIQILALVPKIKGESQRCGSPYYCQNPAIASLAAYPTAGPPLSCRFVECWRNVVCARCILGFFPVATIAISAYISVVIGITVGHVGNFAKMVMIADSYHPASIKKLDPLVVPSPILRFHRSAPLEHLAYPIEQIFDV